MSEPVRMMDSFVPGWPKALAAPWGPYRAKVVEVHDGDTVTVEIVPYFDDRKEVRVRLYGMNAPELSTPEGEQAAEYLSRLLLVGSNVRFTPLINRAGQPVRSFDRQVGTIEVDCGQLGPAEDVIHSMVQAGHGYYCDADLRPLDGPPTPIRRWVEPA